MTEGLLTPDTVVTACTACFEIKISLYPQNELVFILRFHSHHQILSLLVEHRASMKSFQALRSPAIPLTSFHDFLVLLISFSIVLRHVLFGLTLLLHPRGFQFNAVFSIAPVSLRNVCPIQFHFLLFILFSIDF